LGSGLAFTHRGGNARPDPSPERFSLQKAGR
jgi:hypothetical protein